MVFLPAFKLYLYLFLYQILASCCYIFSTFAFLYSSSASFISCTFCRC